MKSPPYYCAMERTVSSLIRHLMPTGDLARGFACLSRFYSVILQQRNNKTLATMKKGLILEGGAMRGMFTVGVTDVMMEHGIEPDGVIGVSAGAAFGCNYKSRQPGRALRYNKIFARDKRYSGIGSLLKTGDFFNAEFAYHTVPTQHDKFDNETFERNPMEFYLVCTDIDTGKAVYKKCERGGHEFFDWVRASASMPVVSRAVELDGMKLLDGGITDSIPLKFFESIGYLRNIVILTQPRDYVKHPNKAMPLIKISLRKHRGAVEAMMRRHVMYNEQTSYVAMAENEGRCLVIRPDSKLPIGHISHDPEEMQRVYDIGRETGLRHVEAMKKFLSAPE